jgi:hypothetical protein
MTEFEMQICPLPTPGDEVLVNTGPYGVPGTNWCLVTRIDDGPFTLFPVVVRVDPDQFTVDRRYGTYQQGEILGWRPADPPRPTQPCAYALFCAGFAATGWALMVVLGMSWQSALTVYLLCAGVAAVWGPAECAAAR